MQYYDFEVLQGDDVIAAERAVALDDARAAWPKVIGMASALEMPGCRIRVREQQGDTIILIGATAACRYPFPRRTADVAKNAPRLRE
jgi:hypothetical protein